MLNIAICGTVDNATSLGRQNVPGHFFFGIFGCTLSKVYRLRQNNLMRGYCNVGSHPASTRSHSACNALQKCICCKVRNPSSTLSRSLLYLLASFNITEGKNLRQRFKNSTKLEKSCEQGQGNSESCENLSLNFKYLNVSNYYVPCFHGKRTS